MDTNYIIETKNLTKQYGSQKSVADLNIHVKRGRIYGLLGRNGAGKTTTFYMVVGLVKANGGSVFLGDKDLTTVPMNIRAKEGIGYLPQEASIFRKLSVEDNIKLVLQMNDKLNEEEKILGYFSFRWRKKKGRACTCACGKSGIYSAG